MKCRHCGTELKLPLVDRIDHLYQDRHEQNVRFFLHHGDMTDSSSLIRNIQQIQPDEIYNYHPENSHVIPALIRRFHEAKVNQAPSVTIWGTGTPRREFLYVDDMAAASVHVMNLDKATYEQHTQPMLSHINVGCGEDVTILQVAQAVARTVGYTGQILTDPTKPEGTPRKLMDSSRLNALGWQAQVGLEAGLKSAYEDFLTNYATQD